MIHEFSYVNRSEKRKGERWRQPLNDSLLDCFTSKRNKKKRYINVWISGSPLLRLFIPITIYVNQRHKIGLGSIGPQEYVYLSLVYVFIRPRKKIDPIVKVFITNLSSNNKHSENADTSTSVTFELEL